MSTLKVTNIENPDGGGVSAKIADVGGGQLSNRNLIINGAMRVAQRGTSSTATGYKTCDRWKVAWGQGAVTQTQESLTTGAPYDEGFRYFLRAQNTTTSTASNSYRELIQNLEGQDIANSGWNYKSSASYITLSYWVRSSVAQDYEAIVLTRDGTNRAYSFPFTLAANTWTKITETIPGSATNQIDNDNGLGLTVTIVAYYGTDYTSSSNADRTWRDRTATDDFAPVMTSTWANTTNATFDLTGVQLEVGSFATTFEHRSYGDELARCQRYYYKAVGGLLDRNYNYGDVSRNVFFRYSLPVSLRDHSSAVETAQGDINDGSTFTTWNYLAARDANGIVIGKNSIAAGNFVDLNEISVDNEL